jgi:hypothetical protein
MAAFLVLALIVAAVLHEQILFAFSSNPALNGLILFTILIGVVYAFRQVLMLQREIDWVEQFRSAQPRLATAPTPDLLAPVAQMLGERHGRVSLSTASMRSLLDSIGARLDERRELVRYLTGLLVFLGLLGTFWGLLDTIGAVGRTIGTLQVQVEDVGAFLAGLKGGLEAPLAGMSIAFSSSLFGLSGSLVVGFLELQASQAQNRFYNDFEEWLSGHTRLSAGGMADTDNSVPAYVQALLEQTADSLDNLQRVIARNEESRNQSQSALLQLTEQLSGLSDQMRAEQELLRRLAEAQTDLKPVLLRLATAQEQEPAGAMDEASRTHIRNLEFYAVRLLEELQQGRAQTVQEMRSEIKLLARTLAAIGDDWRRDRTQR